MGGGDSSGGKGKKLVSEINITPLVDTLLVLLIIFMVTAPAMTRTIGIDLPSADGARAEKMVVDEEKEFLVVGISVDDQIVFEEKNYSQSDFMNQFSTLVAGMEPEKYSFKRTRTWPMTDWFRSWFFCKIRDMKK